MLDGRSWNPSWRWHERRVPLVRVRCDDGIVGIGEGWSADNDTAPFHARFARVAPALVGTEATRAVRPGEDAASMPLRPVAGKDVDGGAELCHDDLGLARAADWADAAVASAIDVALWDAQAKSRRVPLFALLGGYRRATPVYASGGLYRDGEGIAELAAEMRRYVQSGFRAVKLKIGACGMEDDLARVAAVRGAVGRYVDIIVDALGRLPREAASAWFAGLNGLGVQAVQAPLPASDLTGLAELTRVGCPLAIAGEAEWDHRRLARLVQEHAVGMLQICIGLCGGISGALAVTDMAAKAGVGVTLQCHGSAVLQAASLHLGAACAAVESVEFHMFHTYMRDALPLSMRVPRGGHVMVDERPGIGMDAGDL